MSKIIILDDVESCEDCRVCKDVTVCMLTYQWVFPNCREGTKPDNCPLQDLPSKMALENRWFSKEYAEGYNQCIDDILNR